MERSTMLRAYTFEVLALVAFGLFFAVIANMAVLP
jgi:hypothetical protein